MDRIIFSSDVERPSQEDFDDFARALAPAYSCRGCGSPKSRSPIEAAGPYKEIPSKGIDVLAQSLAHSAARQAAGELGVPTPGVKWFGCIRANKMRKPQGFFVHSDPDSIWIRAGLPEDRIAQTARHEVAHLADFRDPHRLSGILKRRGLASDDSEVRAELFEEKPEPFKGGAIIVTQKKIPLHVGGNFV